MADATYDAIIIGAGHNGMALGAYLARSGWDVAIFEKRGEEGGGLCTEEVTRPASPQTPPATPPPRAAVCPLYDALEPPRRGLRSLRPPVQMGSIFSDGTAL